MPKYVWKLRRGTGFSLIPIFSYRFPCEARFTRTGLRVKTERTEYMWRGVRACFEHATYSRTGATYENSVSNFTAVDTEFDTRFRVAESLYYYVSQTVVPHKIYCYIRLIRSSYMLCGTLAVCWSLHIAS